MAYKRITTMILTTMTKKLLLLSVLLVFWIVVGCSPESGDTGKTTKQPTQPFDKDVAHPEINGVQLHIPRKYISIERDKPSEAMKSVYLDFYLPDMKSPKDIPDINEWPNEKHVRTHTGGSIRDIRRVSNCERLGLCEDKDNPRDPRWRDPIQRLFQADLRSHGHKNTTCLRGGVLNQDLGLMVYPSIEWAHSTKQSEFYIKGDPCQPDFYLLCHVPGEVYVSPVCQRYTALKNRLLLRYHFDRRQLADYQRIHEGWMQRIQELMNPNDQ
ncbi:hypothetical protein EZI54_21655 [Marinobacter halodurans]|uniref:Lipoprotein n=1 Tax=Marinobacter halodurans TaxID=2528979 RepID=A0ABY1ZE73_9GAMM|nr:hypothetical protein [Marinobacter halodurans]TBW48116.1 hypothetical protein EZI54_21655 [Marinobacter halodurans]